MLLSEFNKNLLQEWDYEKNDISPDQITRQSAKKVWWKCNKNHSWEAKVYHRTGKNKSGCPFCSNHKVLKGYNDLQSQFPDIAKEWDYEKNFSEYCLKPDEIVSGSNKKVYWKCKNNHSWQATIVNRTKKNKTSCPQCNNNKTSFGEQCIYYYLLPYNAKNRFKVDNMEVDIYLPDFNIHIESDKNMPVGIEFNGEYWHKNKKEKDLIKELKLSHKVKMYYVCESDKNEIKGNKIFFNKKKYNLNLEWAIKTLFTLLNLNIDVNIERDKQVIYKNSVKEEKENSLAIKRPELLKEWDYNKNAISPEQITQGSNKKIYWKCSKNHSYEMSVSSRIRGYNCPYCSRHKVLNDFNDLQSQFPDIAKEWDYEKNTIKPNEITPGSEKKVYWKCNNGHSWKCSITSRTSKRKSGCPVCSNRKVLKGYNDLLSNFPDICKEWDYELNTMKPDEVAPGSGKKVYWKCKNNHSWLAIIKSRTGKNKTGCPYCSGNKVLKGYNDLLTLNPEICKEWDYEKNDYNPDEFTIGNSRKKIWWKCPNNHSWLAAIYDRTKINKTSCPYCANKKVLKGFNNLLSNFPDICKEWDYEKNNIKPDEITTGSNKKVYWKCKNNHSWQASVYSRTGKTKSSCPYCANKKVLKGYNDLLSNFPDICKEWDYEKNVIKPDEITPGSEKKVYWKCKNNHSWETKVYSRTSTYKSGCPYCAKKKRSTVIQGEK